MVTQKNIHLKNLTELVELLNEVFSYFDEVAEKYGLEKIKTIGDCYMVAAGVPTHRTDHAQAITRLALAYQNEGKLKEAEKTYLRAIELNSKNPSLYHLLHSI